MNIEELRREAAAQAAREIKSGTVIGLGTGRTAAYVVRILGELLQKGELRDVRGVPTSEATARLAGECGVPLAELNDEPELDVTLDGADEIDDRLQLVKGLGGALLREKMVAAASRRFLVVADYEKRVPRLGTRAPLPIEVVRFGWRTHVPFLEKLGAQPKLRAASDGQPYVTDNSNYILDAHFPGGIADAPALAQMLAERPGVVEHGLFLGMAERAFVAATDGVDCLTR